MPNATEPRWPAEAIVSEANGTRSRSAATLITGQNLKAMAVLGKITASGKYTALAPAAGDGSQNAAAILLAPVDATAADKPCVVIDGDAEFNKAELDWNTMNAGQITAAIAQFAALGIKIRSAV